MILKDLEKIFHDDLDALYGKQEVSSFFVLIINFYYNISRLQLALNPEISINKEEQAPFFKALKHLKEEKPIQYILGETEFLGLPFKVNKNTLIPRPETEELVRWIVQYSEWKHQRFLIDKEKKRHLNILDVGTGSGCIAISLAKNIPGAKVYAIDISVEALKIAQLNAKLNNVDITFIKEDILKVTIDRWNSELDFDIIVSNPPYVRNMEKKKMTANVLDNEPHLALFVDDDNPLLFYKKITEFAAQKLCNNGELFFEINEYLGNETVELLKEYNFINIELKNDLFGKNRMLKGSKSEITFAN